MLFSLVFVAGTVSARGGERSEREREREREKGREADFLA